MKRDMDLVRRIMLAIEDDRAPADLDFTELGHTKEAVTYHVKLLVEAGLVVGGNKVIGRKPVQALHF